MDDSFRYVADSQVSLKIFHLKYYPITKCELTDKSCGDGGEATVCNVMTTVTVYRKDLSSKEIGKMDPKS